MPQVKTVEHKDDGRTRFTVRPCRLCGGWMVTVGKRQRVKVSRAPRRRFTVRRQQRVASKPTKKAAVAYAVREAKKRKPSQVLICDSKGKYQSERTYGSDPYPPKG